MTETESNTLIPQENEYENVMAAIDLGSNSFHMVVARVHQGELRILSKLGEKVQLGAGLDENQCLTPEAQERAQACLARFAQKLKHIPVQNIRAVGTNTLRAAKNATTFRHKAQRALDVPIEVIAGREEARLVYLGVAHTLSDDSDRRLVIDIGGGSTEFIIGERFEAKALESLHMGCVSYSQRFFSDGKIREPAFEMAVKEAASEILYIKSQYQAYGWEEAVGSSGTFKAVAAVIQQLGLAANGITRESLKALCKKVIKIGDCQKLGELGVKKDRLNTFVGGLAIVKACFETLAIDVLHVSEGALREGVLYDLLGRSGHEDVRERTILAMADRFGVDVNHGGRVAKTAGYLFDLASPNWNLGAEYPRNLLRWGAMLHEVGLAIAHSQFHKHGAYLVEYSDLPGFSQPIQKSLSLLVRCHRRKLLKSLFNEIEEGERLDLVHLVILLRLAVLLQRGRGNALNNAFEFKVESNQIRFVFSRQWISEHPLTLMDLERESEYLTKIDHKLSLEIEDE